MPNETPNPAPSVHAFHVMTKPIGPICNLDCQYCFYLEKEKLYPDTKDFRMRDDVLAKYVRDYIERQDVPEISFAWQGGEPTMMGLGFFRRVVELQKQYANGKNVTNAFQTNGVLLDADWCQFLHEHRFLIGLSIDGPRELHDHYRVDKGGKPTFDRVMHAWELLQQHKVEHNILTVVNRHNSRHPLDVYRFLRQHRAQFMQFIPLVERVGHGEMFATPPQSPVSEPPSPVTPWSVESKQWGEFQCAIFDEWIRHDVGKVFVMSFENHLGTWMGLPASLCVFAEHCGTALALEHNGDLYSCDHYVYPEFKLGNIMAAPMDELVYSPAQVKFGRDKADRLPQYCRRCEVRFACNGECPKHRFIQTPDGEDGLNYLCAGYKKFFTHIDPYLRLLADVVRSGQPAETVMQVIAERERKPSAAPSRNDPCPCGSGKKLKNCCGEKTK
jgi:uncharacterized protein